MVSSFVVSPSFVRSSVRSTVRSNVRSRGVRSSSAFLFVLSGFWWVVSAGDLGCCTGLCRPKKGDTGRFGGRENGRGLSSGTGGDPNGLRDKTDLNDCVLVLLVLDFSAKTGVASVCGVRRLLACLFLCSCTTAGQEWSFGEERGVVFVRVRRASTTFLLFLGGEKFCVKKCSRPGLNRGPFGY